MLTRANVAASSAALLAPPAKCWTRSYQVDMGETSLDSSGRIEARHSQTDREKKRQVEIWVENEFIPPPPPKKNTRRSKTRSLKSTNILLQHESLRFCQGCLYIHINLPLNK